MRRFFQLRTLFFLVLGIFLFDACTTDETPPDAISPSIEVTGTTTVGASDTIKLTLTGTQGDNALNLVEFQIDGSLLDASLIMINGAPAASNRVLLFDADRAGFTWDVSILPHAMGSASYSFIVEDDAATPNTGTVSIDVLVEDAEPTVTIDGTTMLIAPADGTAKFILNVETNGSDLSTIEIQEEGVAITDLTRLRIGGIMQANEFTANPFDISASAYATGISAEEVFITAQATTATTVNYTIIVTNVGGQSDSQDFTITTDGTDINATHTGTLLENAAGPNPTGGMILSTGTTVSVNDAAADIIDQGIDGDGNWLQQIGTANGSTMRALSQGQIDAGFAFSDVLFKEEILEGWNLATAIPGGISGTVALGDVFFVEVGTDYYVIQCTLVENTAGDNADKYEFDIKVAEF